jgi:hypothetical protein
MKLYIYQHSDFYLTSATEFEECTDIETIFHKTLCKHYKIVTKIQEADIAYIPFFMGSAYYSMDRKKCKDIWSDVYKPILANRAKIPHFIIWGYILYNVDLSFIDQDIYIIALEGEVTSTSDRQYEYESDRMIIVPYILKKQSHHSAKRVTVVDNNRINDLFEYSKSTFQDRKQLAYVGRDYDDKRNIVLTHLKDQFTLLNYNPSTTDPFDIYRQSKAVVVLNGDTSTRKAFYHALSCMAMPIIYESTLMEYDDLYRGTFESIQDFCIIIPDHHGIIDIKYLNHITEIIHHELNRYDESMVERLYKVFNRYNYFYMIQNIPAPVHHTMHCILKHHKRCKKGKKPFIYIQDTKLFEELKNELPIQISKYEVIDSINFLNEGYGEIKSDNMFQTSQYALEIMFNGYIKKYPLKTKCYQKADMVYLPCYPFLKAWTSRPYFFDVVKSGKHAQDALAFIKDPNKLHFIVYSDVMWYDSRVFINNISNFPKNVRVIAFDTVNDSRIIKAPYPCELHLTFRDPDILYERDTLLSYFGRSRSIVDELIKKNYPEHEFRLLKVEMDGWKSANTTSYTNTIWDLYKRSIFSLQPHGDMPTRRGFYQSIFCGCIPVVFTRNKLGYHGVCGIDIHRVAVVVDERTNIIDTLKSITKEKKEEYISCMREYIRRLQYSVYFDKNDAFGNLIHNLSTLV